MIRNHDDDVSVHRNGIRPNVHEDEMDQRYGKLRAMGVSGEWLITIDH